MIAPITLIRRRTLPQKALNFPLPPREALGHDGAFEPAFTAADIAGRFGEQQPDSLHFMFLAFSLCSDRENPIPQGGQVIRKQPALGALVCAIALAGCADPDVRRAHEAIEHQLNDPLSVQYRNERHASAAVCGQFNAKNAMGGYVGFRDYVFLPSSFSLYVSPAAAPGGDGADADELWKGTTAHVLACVDNVDAATLGLAMKKYDAELAGRRDKCGKTLSYDCIGGDQEAAYKAVVAEFGRK